jgi:hypothetical protein
VRSHNPPEGGTSIWGVPPALRDGQTSPPPLGYALAIRPNPGKQEVSMGQRRPAQSSSLCCRL